MKYLIYVLPLLLVGQVNAFNASIQHQPTQNPTRSVVGPHKKIISYDEALRIINDCAVYEDASGTVYDAVRFLERNSYRLYRDRQEADAL